MKKVGDWTRPLPEMRRHPTPAPDWWGPLVYIIFAAALLLAVIVAILGIA